MTSVPADGTASGRASLAVDDSLIHERDLTDLMKDWRSGRATRRLGEAISNAYVGIFAFVMLGAMIANVIVQAQGSVSNCTTDTCTSARTLLPWATVAVSIALALAISRLFGPVLASAAEGFWLLDAPVRRGRLLAPRLYAVVAVTIGVGALLGGLVAALTGSSLVAIVGWVLATGLAAGGAVALAAAQQGRDDNVVTRVLSALFALVTLAALLAVVMVAAGRLQLPPLDSMTTVVAGAVAGVGLLGGGLMLILARRHLNRLQRTRLTSGGSLAKGLSGAMFALDLGLMSDILTERRCEEIGHVRIRRGRSSGLTTLALRDAQRLLRFPRPLLPFAVSIVVPYVLDALGLAVIAPVVSAIALFAAVTGMLGGLRVLSRSGGMQRSMPFSPGQIKRASVIVPAILCVLWAFATFPAYLGFGEGAVVRTIPDAMIISEIVAAAGLLGAIRWTVAKPINFNAPMVATGAGAMPPGMIANLIRGFDLCLLITAPLIFGLPWIISVVLVLICAFVLLGSFNMAEMQEKAKQQQAEYDKVKASRTR
ncbi:DUF6297 family protein [Microlunatus sp. Y2014]|uniref:DUF6297 family protein n=1 Tax=Microlunatus sp. Y2014 TaxID=3418488 RepID=UPI003DA70809